MKKINKGDRKQIFLRKSIGIGLELQEYYAIYGKGKRNKPKSWKDYSKNQYKNKVII